MSRQKLIWSVFVLAGIAVALGLIFMQRKGGQEPIKIGAVLAMSGPGADCGVDLSNGMLLAIEEINKWGGINGKRIELIIQDSKTDPEEGKRAFERIEKAHHPLLYVSVLSTVSMAVAPLAEKYKVAVVGLIVTAPELTEQNNWVFRYYPTAKHEISPIMSILQQLKLKDSGIIYLDDEYGRSVFGRFKEAFEEAGGKLRSQVFQAGETDFKKYITELKHCPAIYVVGLATYIKEILKELRKEDYKGAILVTSTATLYSIRGKPEADGIYVASPLIFNPDFFFASELKQKYEARYNRPLTIYAANGYDFIKFLTGVLEDRELSRKSIRSLLEEEFFYTGVFGDLEIKPKEREINFSLFPAQIVNGQIRFID